jgi:hypothetical protein
MKVYSGPISKVWTELMADVAAPGCGELPGYVASVSDEPDRENEPCRRALDEALKKAGKPLTQTVANTIFPDSLWDPHDSRQSLYDRYATLWPRINADPANRHGVYFRRMIHYETAAGSVNQIEAIVQNYLSGNHRRSALQVSIYDPAHDLSNSRRRGFPCLQHFVVVPIGDDELQLTAFYATQTVFDKAYGNLLGLWRLGRFFGHALDRRIARVICFVSVGLIGGVGRTEARELVA